MKRSGNKLEFFGGFENLDNIAQDFQDLKDSTFLEDLNQLNFSKLSINSEDFSNPKLTRTPINPDAVNDFFMKDF